MSIKIFSGFRYASGTLLVHQQTYFPPYFVPGQGFKMPFWLQYGKIAIIVNCFQYHGHHGVTTWFAQPQKLFNMAVSLQNWHILIPGS